ncbi:hypothetical protein Rhe02_79790 [Rhizocola hellebori]|uniref:Uncharacterized protein n=1 Tax=Rhizocola hellebori TaxID=1392758 RepID=A0A8J3VKU9_9ACTN|nr:hypothetical protein Rhe02_79790 [Rhizocola hellebori]
MFSEMSMAIMAATNRAATTTPASTNTSIRRLSFAGAAACGAGGSAGSAGPAGIEASLGVDSVMAGDANGFLDDL